MSNDYSPHTNQILVPEKRSTFGITRAGTSLAVELDHPAYDCIYLALAIERGWQFATADERFQRKVREDQPRQYSDIVLSLPEAAAALTKGGS